MQMSKRATERLDGAVLDRIETAIDRYRDEQDPLLEILRDVQEFAGYLSEDVLLSVSELMRVPASQVHGVATFYSMLSTSPKGKNVIRICESAPCHVMGSDSIIKAVTDELKISMGETTEDGVFTLESTSCLGICSVGPAMMVNDRVYGNLTREKVRMIIRRHMDRGAVAQ